MDLVIEIILLGMHNQDSNSCKLYRIKGTPLFNQVKNMMRNMVPETYLKSTPQIYKVVIMFMIWLYKGSKKCYWNRDKIKCNYKSRLYSIIVVTIPSNNQAFKELLSKC
jgi:hypothetical protein